MTGVYPVFDNIFKVGTAGTESTTSDMKTVADLTSFSVSINNTIEEWTPMTSQGWVRRLTTGKSVSITLSGKRNVGDAGNDYLASLAWKTGQDTTTKFEWELPDGTKISYNAVVNITGLGGESTAVDALEAEFLSDGAITVIEPATV